MKLCKHPSVDHAVNPCMQEEENLQNQVDKLLALKPDIILVEKSVARTAQDELLERGISLVLNMKRSVLDFLARCTDAEVCFHGVSRL